MWTLHCAPGAPAFTRPSHIEKRGGGGVCTTPHGVHPLAWPPRLASGSTSPPHHSTPAWTPPHPPLADPPPPQRKHGRRRSPWRGVPPPAARFDPTWRDRVRRPLAVRRPTFFGSPSGCARASGGSARFQIPPRRHRPQNPPPPFRRECFPHQWPGLQYPGHANDGAMGGSVPPSRWAGGCHTPPRLPARCRCGCLTFTAEAPHNAPLQGVRPGAAFSEEAQSDVAIGHVLDRWTPPHGRICMT